MQSQTVGENAVLEKFLGGESSGPSAKRRRTDNQGQGQVVNQSSSELNSGGTATIASLNQQALTNLYYRHVPRQPLGTLREKMRNVAGVDTKQIADVQFLYNVCILTVNSGYKAQLVKKLADHLQKWTLDLSFDPSNPLSSSVEDERKAQRKKLISQVSKLIGTAKNRNLKKFYGAWMAELLAEL